MRRALGRTSWQVISYVGVGFVVGVVLACLVSDSERAAPPFQFRAGEVLLLLKDSELFLGPEPLNLGDSVTLLRLNRPRTLTGSCRLNQKALKLRVRERVIGVALRQGDLGLAHELSNVMNRKRVLLALVKAKQAAKFKFCLLRDAVTYAE